MRTSRCGIRRLLFGGLLVAAAGWGCGGGGGSPSAPDEPQTPAEYVARGWERFENDNYAGALSDFDAALAAEDQYGPALGGRAWTLMMRSSSTATMQTALVAFDAALDVGENGGYVLAGKSCARLGTGAWTASASDAQTAMQAAPGFVFEHRASFTSSDLLLVIAGARAASGDFAGALDAADQITDSGIEAGTPATWTVNGVVYDTFSGAVLARLQMLFDTHAG